MLLPTSHLFNPVTNSLQTWQAKTVIRESFHTPLTLLNAVWLNMKTKEIFCISAQCKYQVLKHYFCVLE